MSNKDHPVRRRKIARYGWRPDLPDERDQLYAAPPAKLGPLPAKVDLRQHCPEVYDQGEIGAGPANAIAAAMEMELIRQRKLADFRPSRLFIYYNQRVMEHSVALDSGAQIRDGLKSIKQQGVCPETSWLYDVTPADPHTNVWPLGARPGQKPSPDCYLEALLHQAIRYQRLNRDLAQMKGCLAAGYPFLFGFTAYEAFESAAVTESGVLNLPTAKEAVAGGHAGLAVGYHEVAKRFIVRNSWGTNWGQKGYFTLPYQYLLTPGLARDFWTIRLMEG